MLLLDGFAPDVVEHTISGAPFYYRSIPRASCHFPSLAGRIVQLAALEFSRDWPLAYRHLCRIFNAADRAVLCNEAVMQQSIVQAAESVRQGYDAVINDIRLIHQPWPFSLERIAVPCTLVTGNADPVVTEYARVLQARLPNCRVVERSGEGFAAMLYLHLGVILKQTLLSENTSDVKSSAPSLSAPLV